MTDKQAKGRLGEDTAVRLLERAGFRILTRNFRTRFGEVDLVADDRGTIVFVEVKARTSHAFGAPAESVGRRKQERIIKASEEYLAIERLTGRAVRFDVVGVDLSSNTFEHIKNAFEAGS